MTFLSFSQKNLHDTGVHPKHTLELEDRNKILKAREENDTFYVIKTILMIGDLSSKTVEARRQQWISILKML